MKTFKQLKNLINEGIKKINMSDDELRTAYELRKTLSSRELPKKLGYGGNIHQYLDHPDTKKRAEASGIEYVPQTATSKERHRAARIAWGKSQVPSDHMLKRAYYLRAQGISDKELVTDPQYGFRQHFKNARYLTRHLENNRERFPKNYYPSPAKKVKRSAGFETEVHKDVLSGMSTDAVSKKHGITTNSVRAIMFRQRRKAAQQGTNKMEKQPIKEGWENVRRYVQSRVKQKQESRAGKLAAQRQQHLDDVENVFNHSMTNFARYADNNDIHPDAQKRAKEAWDTLRRLNRRQKKS